MQLCETCGQRHEDGAGRARPLVLFAVLLLLLAGRNWHIGLWWVSIPMTTIAALMLLLAAEIAYHEGVQRPRRQHELWLQERREVWPRVWREG